MFSETHSSVVVSTAHIPEEFAMVLGTLDPRSQFFDGLRYGWRLSVIFVDEVPEEMRPLIHAAKEQGHSYVIYDQGGPVEDGFDSWDW
jgi:hypothetical protein